MQRPWFPFYFSDFYASTVGWPFGARECYLALLCYQWDHGSIPIDDSEMCRRICNCESRLWKRNSEYAMSKFDSQGRNARMLQEMDKCQEISEKRREAVNKRYTNTPTNVGTNVGTKEYTPTPTPTPTVTKKVSKKVTPPSGVVTKFKPPEWVPEEAWKGFVEMRQRIRAPLTDRAKALAVRSLERLRDEGGDVGEILEQSIERGWRGLFGVKKLNGSGGDTAHNDEVMKYLEECERKANEPS